MEFGKTAKTCKILIDHLRGVEDATDFITEKQPIAISALTAIEVLQGARNKGDLKIITKELDAYRILHFNQEISEKSIKMIKEVCLKNSTESTDT